MRAQPSAAPRPRTTRHGEPAAIPAGERIFPADTPGVRVVDGYGVKVSIRRRHLRIEDGIGRQRRTTTYARATCPFRRLLILGHTGYVTLEAIRWCWDLGIGIVQVDADRNLLLASARREVATNRLRRVQALAPYTELGVEAARLVMKSKLAGQRAIAAAFPGGEATASAIDAALRTVEEAATLDEVLAAESLAAFAYWDAWSRLPLTFAGANGRGVPAHWAVFGTRSSPVSGSRRHAANPANALLNYTYALLEAETTLALHASGLDPGLGIWHRDEAGRDSLSLDVMEATRPAVDRLVLELVTREPLRLRDFHETRQGACRVLPPLTHHLATWMPTLAEAADPTVLQLGRLFDRTITTDQVPSLRLGRARRSEHRRTPSHPRTTTAIVRGCRTCGLVLTDGWRDPYCADCGPERPADGGTGHRAAGARVTQARRDSIRRQRLAAVEWDRMHAHRPDPAEFTREILPDLTGMSYSALSRATGLSRRYCKLIATGQAIPHPMHWGAFRAASQAVSRGASAPHRARWHG